MENGEHAKIRENNERNDKKRKCERKENGKHAKIRENNEREKGQEEKV